MRANLDAFRAAYLKGLALPTARAHGWAMQELLSDPLRQAVDVLLDDEQGRRVIVYVEPRREGARSLLTTRFLALSYYKADRELDDKLVADVVRGVGALFKQRELVLKQSDVDAIFAVEAEAQVGASAVVELRINRDCNEDCLFCNTPPESFAILAGRPQVLAELERNYALGYRNVTFTGRETTLDPNLEEYLLAARTMGYAERRIQSNGTTLSSPAYLAKLLAAGLTAVQFSLHTFDAATFAALVGKASLLEKAVTGLRNVLASPGLACEVLFVVTTMNIGELERFVDTLASDFPIERLSLILSPMAPVGWGEQRADLIPRLSALRPAMERALARCAEHKLKVTIPHRCGMPLCATAPRFYPRNMDFYAAPGSTVEASKAKAPQCRSCVFDTRCVGVWRQALELYGEAELVPVTAL